MAQRISRAKQRIKASGVPFRMPAAGEFPLRLQSVLHVLYLIFNEGYTSSSGAHLHRTDLSGEAIRLARILRELLPEDGEVAGLLALMLLTDARRPARTGENGELVPLAEQDRTRWDRRSIAEGVRLVAVNAAGNLRPRDSGARLPGGRSPARDRADRPGDGSGRAGAAPVDPAGQRGVLHGSLGGCTHPIRTSAGLRRRRGPADHGTRIRSIPTRCRRGPSRSPSSW